jgi:hypothetical protein
MIRPDRPSRLIGWVPVVEWRVILGGPAERTRSPLKRAQGFGRWIRNRPYKDQPRKIKPRERGWVALRDHAGCWDHTGCSWGIGYGITRAVGGASAAGSRQMLGSRRLRDHAGCKQKSTPASAQAALLPNRLLCSVCGPIIAAIPDCSDRGAVFVDRNRAAHRDVFHSCADLLYRAFGLGPGASAGSGRGAPHPG